MKLCTRCLHNSETDAEICSGCGAADFAKTTKDGSVLTLPANAGVPCQRCLKDGHELKFRYFRWILAMLFVDRINMTAGYFCSGCRWKLFGANLGLTLVAGWWGIFALLFRNPLSIVVNVWALFAAPLNAGSLGALAVDELRTDAANEGAARKRLHDLYMQMPTWVQQLDDGDIELVMTDVDFYALLGIDATASEADIKHAYRHAAKLAHPDAGGSGGHEQMLAVNDAHVVLSSPRLRHAYDHRPELAAILEELGRSAETADYADDGAAASEKVVEGWGCRICRVAFESHDDALEHADREHPEVRMIDVVVDIEEELREGGRANPADSERPTQEWRCRTCLAGFNDYELALQHADEAHPELTVVDVRRAVERV